MTLVPKIGSATGAQLWGWECPCGLSACVLYSTELGAQVSALRHLAAKHATAPTEAQKEHR